MKYYMTKWFKYIMIFNYVIILGYVFLLSGRTDTVCENNDHLFCRRGLVGQLFCLLICLTAQLFLKMFF